MLCVLLHIDKSFSDRSFRAFSLGCCWSNNLLKDLIILAMMRLMNITGYEKKKKKTSSHFIQLGLKSRKERVFEIVDIVSWKENHFYVYVGLHCFLGRHLSASLAKISSLQNMLSSTSITFFFFLLQFSFLSMAWKMLDNSSLVFYLALLYITLLSLYSSFLAPSTSCSLCSCQS